MSMLTRTLQMCPLSILERFQVPLQYPVIVTMQRTIRTCILTYIMLDSWGEGKGEIPTPMSTQSSPLYKISGFECTCDLAL